MERLSESFAVGRAADNTQSNGENFSGTKFEEKLRLTTEASESLQTNTKDSDGQSIEKAQNINVSPANLMGEEKQDWRKDGFEIVKRGKDSIEETDEAQAFASGNPISQFEQQHSKVC